MDKHNGMLIGSFLGDAFALELHWIYDTELTKKKYYEMTELGNPMENLYHKGKVSGDFTHYGDQTLNILKLVSKINQPSETDFVDNFKEFMETYKGYIDKASKETISYLEKGIVKGSASDEMGGIARMSPLIFFNRDDRELCKELVVTQTKITHDNEQLFEIGEFFADVTFEVLDGLKPSEAIYELMDDYSTFIKDNIDKAKSKLGEDSIDAIKLFGQACSSSQGFPSVIYLILKYEDDILEALKTNVIAGGDSAARGMILGMVLGAYIGEKNLPKSLLLDINKIDKILWYIS